MSDQADSARAETAPPQGGPIARRLGNLARVLGTILLALVGFVAWAWTAGAIYFSNLPWAWLRTLLAIVFAVSLPVALVLVRRRRRVLIGFATVVGTVVVWWWLILPSNDRDWTEACAVLPRAEVDGDRVTVHNIRNFAYTSKDDYTPRYYDRTFDLNKIQSVDFLVSYWGGVEAIAHTFVSFGFADDVYLAVSIEVRKEKGETYNPLRGLFKQYEIMYVVGDERDLIGSRTKYRGEDVFLYRTKASPANARRLFMAYVEAMNRLVEQPAFYNTITNNCTTNILRHRNSYPPRVAYNVNILLNGYSGLFAYRHGGLDTSVPFEELKRRSHVNARANAAYDAPDFSRRIRMPTEETGGP